MVELIPADIIRFYRETSLDSVVLKREKKQNKLNPAGLEDQLQTAGSHRFLLTATLLKLSPTGIPVYSNLENLT